MIGGGGERKTLRLVARYADACNIFVGPQAARKLEVLRDHCEREGRDYATIEKTTSVPFRADAANGDDELLDELRAMHELGFTVAYVSIRSPDPLPALEVLGAHVIPEISNW
jgi:alkanesulfonate monooxygenase